LQDGHGPLCPVFHAPSDHNLLVQEQRKVLNKKMLKKNKKGQPLMKHRIEQVLEKLMKL
jgi:rRNA processing